MNAGLQAGLLPILMKALAATGLLDPVSAESGVRVSEDILLILAKAVRGLPSKGQHPPHPSWLNKGSTSEICYIEPLKGDHSPDCD